MPIFVKMAEIKVNLFYLFLSVFSILFEELVFYFTIGGEQISGNWIVFVANSLVIGSLIYFMGCIFKRPIVKVIWRSFLFFLMGFPFLIWHLIYAKFRVLYDLKTSFGGASDALSGFMGDILRLIFSVNGIVHILLFFLPFILYLVIGRRYDLSQNKIAEEEPVQAEEPAQEEEPQAEEPVQAEEPAQEEEASQVEESTREELDEEAEAKAISFAKVNLILLAVAVVLVCASIATLRINAPLWKLTGDEYSFEYAVSNFGLLSGLSLDAKNMGRTDSLSGETSLAALTLDNLTPTMGEEAGNVDLNPSMRAGLDADLRGENVPPSATSEENAEIVEEKVLDTSPNVLEIDFDALEQGAAQEYIDLDEYVRVQEPTNRNEYTGLFKGKNLILITAEAFTAEAIDPVLSPTLYRMATKGINFTDYYQPTSAGTTGGEYANVMAMLPSAGGKSMKQCADHHNYLTMGSLLTEQGYYGKAYHNNDYTYYDRHLTHINLGYSDGYMSRGNGMEDYLSKVWPESDLEMMQYTIPLAIEQQPFNLYFMSVSGHSDYTFKTNAMARKHKEEVEGLNYSERVMAYLGSQLELDAAMQYTIEALEKAGIADDTVIVISADHFPYGLDINKSNSYEYLAELYGYPITNYLERDHNRLIIWSGCLEKEEPIVVNSPTFSPDITPTLCNLFGIEYDSRLFVGRDVLSDAPALIYNLSYDWKTDYGTFIASSGTFTPINDEIEIPEGYVDGVKKIVRNKINYSKQVLELDYYAHVFPEKEDAWKEMRKRIAEKGTTKEEPEEKPEASPSAPSTSLSPTAAPTAVNLTPVPADPSPVPTPVPTPVSTPVPTSVPTPVPTAMPAQIPSVPVAEEEVVIEFQAE